MEVCPLENIFLCKKSQAMIWKSEIREIQVNTNMYTHIDFPFLFSVVRASGWASSRWWSSGVVLRSLPSAPTMVATKRASIRCSSLRCRRNVALRFVSTDFKDSAYPLYWIHSSMIRFSLLASLHSIPPTNISTNSFLLFTCWCVLLSPHFLTFTSLS